MWKLSAAPSAEAQPIPLSFHRSESASTLRSVINHRLDHMPALSTAAPHLAVDVLPDRDHDGKWLLVLTWHHALVDGIGINLVIEELAEKSASTKRQSFGDDPDISQLGGYAELGRRTDHAVKFIRKIAGKVSCCGDPGAPAGDQQFRVVEFDEATTERVDSRLKELGGELVMSPILLAVVVRAHAKIWRARGQENPIALALTPMQVASPAKRPVFRNHISSAMAAIPATEVDDLESGVGAIQKRLAKFAFGDLRNGLAAMLEFMRHVPPALYLCVPRLHFRGRFASFFQSYTGEFAPGVDTLAGARILNGYNLPSVSSPPGTGMFFSRSRGRFCAVISYRREVVSDTELDIMEASIKADLLG